MVQKWSKNLSKIDPENGHENDPKMILKIYWPRWPFGVLLGVIFGILAKRVQDGA